MPIGKYYKGHGSEVMQKMTKKYGKKKAKKYSTLQLIRGQSIKVRYKLH